MRFDWDESSNDSDERYAGRNAEIRSKVTGSFDRKMFEVEPEANHNRLAAADSEALKIRRDLRTNGNELGRDQAEKTLDTNKYRRSDPIEVAVQNVAMKCMHDNRNSG